MEASAGSEGLRGRGGGRLEALLVAPAWQAEQ